MNLLTYDGKNIKINGKLAFYFYETYGFPPEVFEEHVNESLKDGELRRLHINLAIKIWKNQ